MENEYIFYGSLVSLVLEANGISKETYTVEQYKDAEAELGRAFFAICGQEQVERVHDAFLKWL